MTIKRLIQSRILNLLESNRVILLLGARRVGKTVLISQIFERYNGNKLLLNGEDLDAQDLLKARRISAYDQWAKNLRLLVIDEAQAIFEIGHVLKLLIDTYPDLTIIATGSSAFDLSNSVGEPLVGRQYVFHLFPFAQAELSLQESFFDTKQRLPQRLLYGGYPDVTLMKSVEQKENYLKDIVSAYLMKDILIYQQVKNADKMLKLLKLIAYQVGSEVSYNELANSLQIDRNTIERYLDLFKKVFIIFPLGGFSRNLRKEVTKSVKWYFYDNGLRNALINDFSPLENRNDVGILWQNYVLSERRKMNLYTQRNCNEYFWRTYDQQELDWLEVVSSSITAFEIKWKKKSIKKPVAFAKAYPNASFQIIHQENYLEFIR